MTRKVEKITRDALRAMAVGETIEASYESGYDLESARSVTYQLQKLEGSKYSTCVEGLSLSVTRKA